MQVELKGTILGVRAKEPKQGKSAEPKPKQITSTFELDGVDEDLLAELCEFAGKAKKAIVSAREAAGNLTLPCVAKSMQIDYYLGERKRPSLQVAGVTLRKVVVDSRKEPTAKLVYVEPYSSEVISFQGDNLGMEMRLVIALQQGEMELGEGEGGE